MRDPVALFATLQRGQLQGAAALQGAPGRWPQVWKHVAWLSGVAPRPAPGEALRRNDFEADDFEADDPAAEALRRLAALGCVLEDDPALFENPVTAPNSPGASIVDAWQAVMRGEAPPPIASGDSTDAAAVAIDRVCLRALHHMAIGDFEEARTAARRAFRMTRAEGFPLSQYLAGIVLARYRRLSGTPHLALRILRGLARVAPAPWRRWLSWEAVLSGGIAAASLHGLEPIAGSPADHLVALLRAAQTGNRNGFDATAEALEAAVFFAPQRRDLIRVLGALAPHRQVDPGHPCHPFRNEQVPVPFGLFGLGGSDEDAPSTAVCVAPDRSPVRVLWVGAPLFFGPDLCEAARSRDRTGRTEAALVKAALAGPEGIDELRFFRELYGFEYNRGLHRGVLGVLVHRMRAWLGENATLEREARIALRPQTPFVVPDSSVSQSVMDRVLEYLSRNETGTAKEAGVALGLSLRNVQLTLAELVEQGICHRTRDGRRVTYLLEDTTFQDPTVVDAPR